MKFLSKIEKPATPTAHKHGAVATWSQCTDTYEPTVAGHGWDAEVHAFKYNLQLTALVAKLEDADVAEQFKAAVETGRVSPGLYFLTWAWQNPTNGNLERNPAWLGTTWPQSCADWGIISQELVGTTKQSYHYTIGQPLYDVSGGKYGYSDSTHQMGQTDVVTGSIQQQLDWFKEVFGHYPSFTSYAYGRFILTDFFKDLFIGSRSVTYSGGNTQNAFDRTTALNIGLTMKENDIYKAYGLTEMLSRTASYLRDGIARKGWIRDFSHWHMTSGNEFSEYLRVQRETMGSHDVFTTDFGTAMEHAFLRDMVERSGVCTKGSDLILVVETKDDMATPVQRIYTPISIQVDLTGTVLEGKEIQAIGSKGIRKLAANQFVVEVPYIKGDGFQQVTLKATAEPEYLDFSLPAITTTTLSGSTLKVTTDKPTNLAIFKVATGGNLYEAELVARSNTMDTAHDVDFSGITTTGFDFYIGAITKEKQSVLSVALTL